jgi:rhamnulokinase
MSGNTRHYLACDLGAESGRVMLGSLSESHLAIEEIHRFPNTPLHVGESLHWNIGALFAGIKAGLTKAARRGLSIESVSCDSWGLDYLLFRADGTLIEPAYHYRDPRTAGGVKRLLACIPWETVFAETGIQFMVINTLYHLAAETPERLAAADRLVPIGDAFNYMLCGEARAEVSMASTLQLYNPRTGTWSKPLLEALGIPERLFPPLTRSGTRLGLLKSEIATETGLPQIPVLAVCTHDTGAAVAGVPASGAGWAYLSSGTWSLMGVERNQPIINEACREMNFTNEIGYGGTIRLLKNIIGLWLVQECRRSWARNGQDLDYDTLTGLASRAAPFACLINPDDPRFLNPPDMPQAIIGFCRETGQPPPESPGQIIRCALESLALLYRRTLGQIDRLTGEPVRILHVVGGGSRNGLLNQFTADATRVPVLAGPEEATAMGNVLIQAITLGHVPSLGAARAILKNSTAPRRFEPGDAAAWDDAFRRFEKLIPGSASAAR